MEIILPGSTLDPGSASPSHIKEHQEAVWAVSPVCATFWASEGFGLAHALAFAGPTLGAGAELLPGRLEKLSSSAIASVRLSGPDKAATGAGGGGEGKLFFSSLQCCHRGHLGVVGTARF